MKKQFLCIAFFLFCNVGIHNRATAQTCGVTPAITIGVGNMDQFYFDAFSSVTQPNWNIYKYDWTCNNNPLAGNIVNASVYPATSGYSQICVKIYATDTITHDSCATSTCRIFQAVACDVYPDFEVSVNGLSVTVTGHYYPCYGTNSIDIDFGDGYVAYNL